jgi:PilZ domain/Gram-negative bacterial TonB protein C-terminal
MSTSAEQIGTLSAPVERRFYPRIAPSAPIYIGSDEKTQGVLLNVSENGLLVSTPIALKLNFVSRLSVPLNGLPNAIQVRGRVIWTSESTKRAGIQMLDLSEHDREQIRMWGALGSVQSSQQVVNRPRVAAEALVTPPAPMPTVQSFTEACLIAPTLPAREAGKRSTSALAVALWGLLIGTLCVGALFSFRDVAPRGLFTGFASNPSDSVAAPTMQDNPVSPPQTPDSAAYRVPESGISSHRPSPALATPRKPPADIPAAKAPTEKTNAGAAADPASATSSSATVRAARSQSDTGQTESASPVKQTRETTHLPDLSRLVAPEIEVVVRNDESAASNSTSAQPQPVFRQDTPARSRASVNRVPNLPLQPRAKVPVLNPGPANATSAGTQAAVAGNPVIASTHSPSLITNEAFHGVRTSDVHVIQMAQPENSILEVRSPTGFRSSVLELPSERVLESPSVTMRIRRSILLPPTRPWWPFNRNKKVVVGELLSRVDPQAPHIQIGSGFSVRVKATVARDGHVERVQPVNGSAALVPSVVSAIRQWRYQPTLADDKPVETECYITVQFQAPARTAKQ